MTRIGIGLGLIAALALGVWLYGNSQYRQGKRDIVKEIAAARAASAAEKQEIDNEIDGLPQDELLRRALEFVRPTRPD